MEKKPIFCYTREMTVRRFSQAVSLALGLSISTVASAQRTITLGLGVQSSVGQFIGYLINFLAVISVPVCTALFMLGAFMFVLSTGKEDRVKRGRDLMVGSVEGLAVILGSYAILRMFLYVLYVKI